MECTVHIGGARLITIRQLASLVQLFLLKAEDFSQRFGTRGVLGRLWIVSLGLRVPRVGVGRETKGGLST